MNYRSIGDLARLVRARLDLVPEDIDLVVGIPRSGLLPASIIALHRNLKLCSVEDYLRDLPLRTGETRKPRGAAPARPSAARHVLVVDDSISSGGSMARVRQRLAAEGHGARVLYCAIYARPQMQDRVDIAFETVPHPRIFEWNLFHHAVLSDCCVEIDGVLAAAPGGAVRDGGIGAAPCLMVPTQPIGHIVTARPERLRAQTLAWLDRHGIAFGALHMNDRDDPGSAAAFKAEVYHSLPRCLLFVEADAASAAEIAQRAGKPVLGLAEQRLLHPGASIRRLRRQGRSALGRLARRLGLMPRPDAP